MSQFLLLLERRAAAHRYVLPIEDVLMPRLGARRLLGSAFMLEATSCQDVYDRIREYTPSADGVMIVPLTDERFTRNLRTELDQVTLGMHQAQLATSQVSTVESAIAREQ